VEYRPVTKVAGGLPPRGAFAHLRLFFVAHLWIPRDDADTFQVPAVDDELLLAIVIAVGRGRADDRLCSRFDRQKDRAADERAPYALGITTSNLDIIGPGEAVSAAAAIEEGISPEQLPFSPLIGRQQEPQAIGQQKIISHLAPNVIAAPDIDIEKLSPEFFGAFDAPSDERAKCTCPDAIAFNFANGFSHRLRVTIGDSPNK
jgi:hypothetical protein